MADSVIVVDPTRDNAIEHLIDHWDVAPRVAIELVRRKAVKRLLKNLRPKTTKKACEEADVLEDEIDTGAKEVPVNEDQVEEFASAVAAGCAMAELEDEDDD